MKPLIKKHGGKGPLAVRIASMLPRHRTYLEPFCGGAAVFFAKKDEGVGISEILCDKDGDITNFWNVLREPRDYEEFVDRVSCTPCSEPEFLLSRDRIAADRDETTSMRSKVVRAVDFFVVARQSMGGRGDAHSRPTAGRTRRGMSDGVSSWLKAVERLPEVHARLRRAHILCGDAVRIMEKYDSEDTVCYLDPPYMHETRSGCKEYGEYEMTEDDHMRLLSACLNFRGKILLSGYATDLYDVSLSSWMKTEFDMPNNAASGESKKRKTEVVWTNFDPSL